jgi:hypothetical protein
VTAVLSFERLVVESDEPDPLGGAPADALVPVVDGVRLCDLLGGDRHPGVHYAEVAPPSRHWLGEPADLVDGRVVLLDGSCGIAECCGIVAHIDLGPDHVRWHGLFARGGDPVPPGLSFTFDRAQYEAAIAGVGSIEPQPWAPWDD